MRSRTLLWLACLAAALLVLNGGQYLPADPPKDTKPADGQPAKNPAGWQLGMTWVVTTTTDLTQLGDDAKKKPQKTEPINWQFTVVKMEKVQGQDCFRVEVERLVGEGDKAQKVPPLTTIWADAKSLALRQIRTEFVVQGQIREVTESYEFGNGQSAPVMSPLSSIPLDMPLLSLGGAAKGATTFSYAAVSGPGGKKALNDVGFAVGISQDIKEVKPDAVKELIPADFSKDLSAKPITEVTLSTTEEDKAARRTVRQLWKDDMPWPVYSTNGTTTSKLVPGSIKVNPPKN
jgi:hypothetical protein